MKDFENIRYSVIDRWRRNYIMYGSDETSRTRIVMHINSSLVPAYRHAAELGFCTEHFLSHIGSIGYSITEDGLTFIEFELL